MFVSPSFCILYHKLSSFTRENPGKILRTLFILLRSSCNQPGEYAILTALSKEKRGSFLDYNLLLDLATDLGYRLAMSGAETFRVEESINRLLSAYGIPSETFAIPNCVTVSILTETGKPITRMRRIGVHGNDLDSVEKYNNLCRRICWEKPEVSTAMKWLEEVDRARVFYSLPVATGLLSGSRRLCHFLRRRYAGCTLLRFLRCSGGSY